MMATEFLSGMAFINAYQFCHKLLLYAHSFIVFILLLSNRWFILAVDILDSLLTEKSKYIYRHTVTPPLMGVYRHACVC